MAKDGLLKKQKENFHFSHVCRKRDYLCMEKLNVNQELEFHILECVYNLQRICQKGYLKDN